MNISMINSKLRILYTSVFLSSAMYNILLPAFLGLQIINVELINVVFNVSIQRRNVVKTIQPDTSIIRGTRL